MEAALRAHQAAAIAADIESGLLPARPAAAAAAAAAEEELHPDSIQSLLIGRGVQVVSFADWLAIDSVEVLAGHKVGKPREKITSIHALLSIAAAARNSALS